MVVAVLLEKPLGFLDRAGEVGALARDEIGIKRVQGLAESLVIERQRAQRERASGERDQADAVAFQVGNEVDDPEPRAFEPVRSQVVRQHAARGVHGEEDVDALALHLAPLVALLRAGDGGEDQQHRDQPQAALEVPHAG